MASAQSRSRSVAQQPARPRAGWFQRHRPNLLACGLIILVVLLANSIFLLGLANPNPLQQRSGLATSQTNGPLSGLNTIDPNDGFTTQALGHQAAEQWRHGHIPFWNYYESVGTPLAGEMQSQALSPFVLLFSWSNGGLAFEILMEIIAGIATFFFLRRLNLRRSVAIMGGLAFALNGTFAWLHNAVFNPVAWLPVMLLGVEIALAYTLKKRAYGWLLLMLGIALSLYAGFPETAFINLLLVGVWSLARLIMLDKPLRLALLKKLLVGALGGLLLAAPVLVAFASYLPQADVGWHGGAIGNVGLDPIGIPALLMPYVYGPIFGLIGWAKTTHLAAFWGSVGGYYAVTVFVLALYGLLSKAPRWLKGVLTGWIVIALLKTFSFPVVTKLVNLIPTIKSAAFYRYAPPSIAFALIVMAAWGLQRLLDEGRVTKKLLMTVGAALLVIVGLAALARTASADFATAPHYKVWAIASVLVAVVFLLLMPLVTHVVKPRFLAVILVGLVTVESLIFFMVPQLSTPKLQVDTTPISFLQQHLGLNRFYTLGPIEPNYGSYYDVASINQNDLPVPKAWSEYLVKNLDTNTTGLNFTGNYRANPAGPSSFAEFVAHIDNYRAVGVKYLVTNHLALTDVDPGSYGLTPVFSNGAMDIYEVSNPSPYFVSPSNCQLQPRSRDEVTVTCPQGSELVRKELFVKGWSARANNKALAVTSEAGLFQKVKVPAGTTTLKFSYLPPHMLLGYAALAVAALAVAIPYLPRRRVTVIDKVQGWLA